jgi:hypothetical protein
MASPTRSPGSGAYQEDGCWRKWAIGVYCHPYNLGWAMSEVSQVIHRAPVCDNAHLPEPLAGYRLTASASADAPELVTRRGLRARVPMAGRWCPAGAIASASTFSAASDAACRVRYRAFPRRPALPIRSGRFPPCCAVPCSSSWIVYSRGRLPVGGTPHRTRYHYEGLATSASCSGWIAGKLPIYGAVLVGHAD